MTEKKEIEEENSDYAMQTKAKAKMSAALTAKYQNKLGEALLLLGTLAEMLFDIEEDWADLLYAEMIHQRGVILQMDKNWAGAYENLLDAARLRKNLKDYLGLAYSMFQIAMLKLEQRGSEIEAMPYFLKARPYVRSAIEIAEETGDEKALGNMKHNDAFIFQILKSYQNAITEYCNALTSRINAGDKRGEAITKARMSECYLAIDDIYNAGLLANEALQYFRETNDLKRIEQVLKTKEAITAKKVEKIAKELDELYAKAKTENDYRLVLAKVAEISDLLSDNEEIITKTINAWWAQYYLFLKFNDDFEARKEFVDKIGRWYSTLKNPETATQFGYLYAIALSNLTDNAKKAEKINQEIKILAEKTGNTSLILQVINSRGIKEMADKNWEKAVSIFRGIDNFYVESLKKQENLLPAANISNNYGASLIRGDIDPVSGAIHLLAAAELYSRQESPPAKHFDGLPNRLRESLEKLQPKEVIIPNKEELIVLIEDARTILLPVSDEIKQTQLSREYFDTLILKTEKIRKKITDFANKQPINI